MCFALWKKEYKWNADQAFQSDHDRASYFSLLAHYFYRKLKYNPFGLKRMISQTKFGYNFINIKILLNLKEVSRSCVEFVVAFYKKNDSE